VSTCQQLGATVVLHGTDFGEARAHAHKIAAEKGLAYINGYDDPAIIAGQGTMGLEIVEQIPDLEAVVVPVGGAGLLAGVSLAVKTLRPHAKVSLLKRRMLRAFQPRLKRTNRSRSQCFRRSQMGSPFRRSAQMRSKLRDHS
jgi:Threonine dehydratase